MADWNGVPFRRLLASADRLSEAAMAFADVDFHVEAPETVLSGVLDQAALHGLLERIQALGLELVDIRRV